MSVPSDEEDDESPSGTYSTPFGELTFDDDGSTEPDAGRRGRNNRLLLIGIAVGGVVVLALAVVGIVLVRDYLDDASSLTARMSIRYQSQYRTCLDRGGSRGLCATRAETACASDPGWSVVRDAGTRADQIADICLFGPDSGG